MFVVEVMTVLYVTTLVRVDIEELDVGCNIVVSKLGAEDDVVCIVGTMTDSHGGGGVYNISVGLLLLAVDV